MTRAKTVGRARAGKAVRPTRRRTPAWASVAGLATAFALGLAVAFLLSSATGPSATEQRINELQQAEAKRDIELIKLLNDNAKTTRDNLMPLLAAMSESAPLDEASPRTAPTTAVIAEWRRTVVAELERFPNNTSAGNGVNVTRTALKTALEQLEAAVDLFETASAQPKPLQDALIAQAGTQRTIALRTWSVAAVQLDVINVDAGNGHVHVYLTTSQEAGGLAPDGSPEGTR